ncbi:MAG TPA: hypothetical protein VEL28_14780 [Candidatus Binatia bacterium]|nr:hypothetical protein [Candidatus Binatia bacterium]
MGSNETTANMAAVGAAIGAIMYWLVNLIVVSFLGEGAMKGFPDEALIVAVTWVFCRYAGGTPPPQAIASIVLFVSMLGLSACAMTYDLMGMRVMISTAVSVEPAPAVQNDPGGESGDEEVDGWRR